MADNAIDLLRSANATDRAFSCDKTICQLIEEQVKETPDLPALYYEGEVLSYSEFNLRSNQVARYLIETLGNPLEADTLIPVLLDRSIEMLLGIHGVMKAGAAYVPIDTEAPLARLRFILGELECPVIVTTSQHREKLENLSDLDFTPVYLDEDWKRIASQSGESPESQASSTSLAYMIYTSGSTGEPKGVMIEHQGLVNRVEWMQKEYQLDSNRRVLHKTPYTFDVSVWELVWPFITGAALVIAKPRAHMHMRYLSALIDEHEVTDIHFVPSVLNLFLEFTPPQSGSSLTNTYCSGEALSRETVTRFFEAFPSCRLHNLYGPTEASIDVSYWECVPERIEAQPSIPIGKPIDNTQLLILDEAMNPLSAGKEGELYIGGVGLARGYFNRPELTRERFIENPLNDLLNGKSPRLYQTGDLARWLPDGNIEFLGRSDFQVKIHGLRIELGEIETALSQLSVVKTATVCARDHQGTSMLVAFIETESDFAPETAKQFLARSLPAYMIPSKFVTISTTPLTSSGKTDRKALLEQLD